MASLSNRSLAAPIASPMRAALIGVALLLAVPLGLRVMTSQETSFYRSNGMVPDARTAVRLARVALEPVQHSCATAREATAQLDGETWIVEMRPEIGAGCRVQLDRHDGQLFRIDA